MLKEIWILRLSHRRERDKRVTTHLALVGRAFNASGMVYTGDRDEVLESKISEVNKRWGGNFKISFIENPIKWINLMKSKGFIVIHLTMYGLNINKMINTLKKFNKLILIVGSEKVDPIYYKISDYNIAVGNQPHSEISAIAVFLDRIYEGRELEIEFKDAEVYIIPSERGKLVKKKIN